jgi:malate dehydrogenase (oxaloacetate-decarboxylating)(NADP+)
VLAGLLAASRLLGADFSELRILFLGAGSAATGIADLIVAARRATGLSESQARAGLWFVNRSGLVVAGNGPYRAHLAAYAHDIPARGLADAIRDLRPQVLIGASGAPGIFTEPVIRLMAQLNERPVIFALSNPTSRAECTAEQAYRWSGGRAVYAGGSPFDPVTFDGRTLRPGQANNAYVFPGIGLGALACRASTLSDAMFLAAARTLAARVSARDLAGGMVYPPLTDIRHVSVAIAQAVAETAWDSGLAGVERTKDCARLIREMMYDPVY